MNPNSNAHTTNRMCAIAARAMPVAPIGWTAPAGLDLITSTEALDNAGRYVETANIPTDLSAVIVSAFGDPGAAGLAQRLSCPVIGIGAAAARAAAKTGQPFAVATTTPALAERINVLMTAHSGNTPYVGCFTAAEDPELLMANDENLDAALLGAIRKAAQAGAAHVIIGGGPLGEAAERLRAITPLPLLNPILCAAHEVANIIGVSHDEA